ncbi:MAG: diaminopimelate decarboxylase, partial [Oscillospiraceae bacterium]
LYGAKYDILIANKAGKQRDFLATIAGKCCESGDLLAENTLIQNPDVGDILAVTATGAYNYSMASNYNRIPRPAVIMVDDNKSRVIIKRESLEDISKNDL